MKRLIRALRQASLILALLISPIFGQADDDSEPLLLGLWASIDGNLLESGLNNLVDVNNLGLKVLSGKFTLSQTGLAVQAILDGTFLSTLTVGVDDTGHDVKFFGATTGVFFLWDESADKLIIEGGPLRTQRLGVPSQAIEIGSGDTHKIFVSGSKVFQFINESISDGFEWTVFNNIIAMSIEHGGEHTYLAIKGQTKFNDRNAVTYFDEFTMKVLDETNENWILNAGSDGAAVDPVVVIARNGTVFLDAGVGDGSVAEDGSQIVWAIPVQVGDGSLVLEARLKIEDITGVSVNVGLTDITTLEEPFSIATTTITSIADNAICFVFDDGADTKEWFRAGTDATTDATGQGATGTAPVNDTYQILRIEIDADGEGAEFFINGVSEGELTAAAIHATTDAFFTIIIVGDAGNSAAVGVTIDYMYIAYSR